MLPDQQVRAEQVRPTREEHPIDRPTHLLQPGTRSCTGEDHYVPSRSSDHEVTGHGPSQVVPEPVGEQGAGFQTVEREHQGGWLAVDVHPVQHRVQVLRRPPAQLPPGYS